MSSLPGYTLEEYIAWNWDLVVDDNSGVNTSLHLAEALGMSTTARPRITKEQFAPILALYEPYREQVENKLLETSTTKRKAGVSMRTTASTSYPVK